MTPRQIEICSDVRACSDLFVILENRFGKPYVESYELSNIFMKEDKFWGKFRPVHSAIGHTEINQSQKISYSYNNYCNLVCLSGFDNQVMRIYSDYAYSKVEFITRTQFKKIWSKGDTNYSELKDSVEKGRRLKFKFESTDGHIYILPLHTVEAYKDASGFVAYTEYDGYPEFIRQMDQHSELSEKFLEMESEIEGAGYPHTGFYEDKPFFTSHFVISNNTVKHRFVLGGLLKEKEIPVKDVSIYVSSQ